MATRPDGGRCIKPSSHPITPSRWPTGEKLSREQFQDHQLRGLPSSQGRTGNVPYPAGDAGRQPCDRRGLPDIPLVDSRIRQATWGRRGKRHVVTGRNTYRAGWAKVGTSWKAGRLSSAHARGADRRQAFRHLNGRRSLSVPRVEALHRKEIPLATQTLASDTAALPPRAAPFCASPC